MASIERSRSGVQMAPPALSGINIIIPMAGMSEDFVKAGYRFPKPLVNLVGRPILFWLLDALRLHPVDTVFLALPRQMEVEHAIERRLRDEYPKVDFRFVLLEFRTRGAAETLFITLQHFSRQELTRKTISLDCDSVYTADILAQFRSLPPNLSATWYFEHSGEQALYSYIKLADKDGGNTGCGEDRGFEDNPLSMFDFVVDVREKVAISCHANVGAYGFATGAQLRAHCEAVIDGGPPVPPSPKTSPKHDPLCATSLHLVGNNQNEGQIDEVASAVAAATAAAEAAVASRTAEAVSVQTMSDGHAFDVVLGPKEAGGWYVSAVMRNIMHHGAPIVGLRLCPKEDFFDLGSPNLVQGFLNRLRNKEIKLHGNRRMRFVFDLDGTLVTPPQHHGDYSSVEPIAQNIALVQSLKAAGYYIIVWTSRESERHRGNVGAIMAAVGKVTFDTLERFRIPYDELIFGKPHADAYIDHRAINSRVDTEKELGWVAREVEDEGSKIAGSVAARAFNTVRPLDDLHVVKTGPRHVMRGEVFWYKHIPAELSDLFPSPVQVYDVGKEIASITMTKVEGVPFTHLLVNLCLTPARLLRLLSSLNRLHRCKAPLSLHSCVHNACADEQAPDAAAGEEESAVPKKLVYANLRAKLAERYDKHRALYNSFSVSELGFNLEEIVQPLLTALKKYEDADRASFADYIHGDPVFSNVLLAKGGGIYLLDMRGALADRLTTSGDINYDLSKVFQSLCGYDFFLEDHAISASAQAHLELLQRTFWDFISCHYPEVSHNDVRLITAQHFFGIVPLHEVRERMRLYLKMSHALMMQEGLLGGSSGPHFR